MSAYIKLIIWHYIIIKHFEYESAEDESSNCTHIHAHTYVPTFMHTHICVCVCMNVEIIVCVMLPFSKWYVFFKKIFKKTPLFNLCVYLLLTGCFDLYCQHCDIFLAAYIKTWLLYIFSTNPNINSVLVVITRRLRCMYIFLYVFPLEL